MRKVTFWVLALLMLIAGALPAAAQDRPSIPELLESGSIGSFSTLLAAVEAAGLVDTLSGEGPFTLFAPTDAAFEASLEALGLTAEDVLADTDTLTQILLYHVLPGNAFFRTLTAGPEVETVQGETVQFGLERGVFSINGVRVTSVDQVASNGLVYVITEVLIPPSIAAALAPDEPSIAEVLSSGEAGSFETLLAAVQAAGLTDALASQGPFTVFAPTDEAFSAALAALGFSVSDILSSGAVLSAVLTYHVIPGTYLAADITDGMTLETLQGDSLVFAAANGGLTVNGSAISGADFVASNGVVHVIDGVLVPAEIAQLLGMTPPAPTPTEAPAVAEPPARPSIPELLAGGDIGSFSTLLAAVEAAGLVDALSGEGPFTVFAPTDDAFAAALEATGLSAEELLADTDTLTQILTYHVVPGRFFFRNLTLGPTLETLEGGELTFNLSGGILTVNGVRITGVDHVGENGNVFVINGVLLPEAIAEALQPAFLRVAHLSPDAGPVDVYINGSLVASDVRFGTVSQFLSVPNGDVNVAIVATQTQSRLDEDFTIPTGEYVTIGVTGLATANPSRLMMTALEEDFSPLGPGQARLSIFHAIEGAPAVDIVAEGIGPLIRVLGYPGTLGDNDGFDIVTVAGRTYEVSIVVSGTEDVVLSGTLRVGAGQNYFVAAAGILTNPQLIIVATEVPAAP